VTNEHVIPRWITRLLGVEDVPVDVHTGPGGDKVYWRRGFATTVKWVCAPCNAGWLATIEAAAAPVLRPLIQSTGLAVPISANSQRILAVWAFKTVLIGALLYDHRGYIPRDEYRRFHSEQVPRLRARVLLSAYSGSNWRARVNVFPENPMPMSRSPLGTRAVIQVGAANFHVFDYQSADDQTHYLELSPDPSYFQQIWPIEELSVTWPPNGRWFTDRDIDSSPFEI
jgi:hypothetical protein